MAFPSNCLPRVVSVTPSCGCALTRANITGMTPQAFENLSSTEIEMHKVIARAPEARLAGVVESTLESILMSSLKDIKGALSKIPVMDNPSVILPYFYMNQRTNINSNYWKVSAGAATVGAGSGGIPASAWDLTVQKSDSPYSTNLASIERYFLPGDYVLVKAVNGSTGVAYSLEYKIIASVNADAGGVNKAKLSLEPNYSAAGWAALSAAAKLVYQPTSGLLLPTGNTTSDYESRCAVLPSNNNRKLLTFWPQTIREQFCYDDEYLLALNAPLTSEYWKKYKQSPLAEQKRQQHMQWMKMLINTAFYGQAINENQAVETYTSLPGVYDPKNPTCLLEYKAKALGFDTQLNNCGRKVDLLGARLNKDDMATTGYDMIRAREASGGSVDRIDWGTDRFTSGAILDIFNSFYKAKYGVANERHYQAGQELKFENQVMLKYNVYQLPSELGGYELAVYTDRFFDDELVAASSGANQNRVRKLWGLDWSDIKLGIGNVNSRNAKTNEADDLFQCVIKINVQHRMNTSTQICPMIEDPSRHQIIENFNVSEAPLLTVSGFSV